MYTFIFEYINKKVIKIFQKECVVHLFLKTFAQTKSIKQTNW